MFKHVITKSRAIGISHYKTIEVPTKVLAEEPKGDLFLQPVEFETELQKLINHMISEMWSDLA